jgi:hypothetical protein
VKQTERLQFDTACNLHSCSENRTSRGRLFRAGPIRKANAGELHLYSRRLSDNIKRAKARVVECSEGEDSTRALAGLLAQRTAILEERDL